MNKLKQTLAALKNDGTDPRRNDVWRVLLFSLNYAGASAITIMMGKWSYYTQNVLQLGILFASIHLPVRLLDAVTDPLIANLFDRYHKDGKFRLFMITGALLSLLPALIVFFYPGAPDIPLWASYVILGSCYAAVIVGNTVVMTATRAGQAIITQDPRQRPLYALGQTVTEAIVSAFVTVVVTGNVIGGMQEPYVWRVSIVVMSVVSVVCVLGAAKAISNRDNALY